MVYLGSVDGDIMAVLFAVKSRYCLSTWFLAPKARMRLEACGIALMFLLYSVEHPKPLVHILSNVGKPQARTHNPPLHY